MKPAPRLRGLLQLLRPRQWVKNGFVLAPLIFTGSFLQVFPPQLTLFERGQHADFLHVLVDGLVDGRTADGPLAGAA